MSSDARHGHYPKAEPLATTIRRASLTADNRRFLRAMPSFSVDRSVPGEMDELLDALEHAEQGEARKGRRQPPAHAPR